MSLVTEWYFLSSFLIFVSSLFLPDPYERKREMAKLRRALRVARRKNSALQKVFTRFSISRDSFAFVRICVYIRSDRSPTTTRPFKSRFRQPRVGSFVANCCRWPCHSRTSSESEIHHREAAESRLVTRTPRAKKKKREKKKSIGNWRVSLGSGVSVLPALPFDVFLG